MNVILNFGSKKEINYYYDYTYYHILLLLLLLHLKRCFSQFNKIIYSIHFTCFNNLFFII